MSLPDVIQRRPSAPDLDYESMRVEALRFIQQTAGDVWTDYNEHDPGVTILEQFCYALTELAYRAGLPLTDLLADPRGLIDMRRQSLHPPWRILPSDPVTANDFRKLLVDRIAGLGNAWLEPWQSGTADSIDGLYDILLYAPDSDPCVCENAPPDPLVRQALAVFARHRPLCEDVRRITVLRPARTLIHATVVIDGGEAPEAVMAELLYRAGQFLAPELRRTSLAELLAAGRRPSQIFEGPLLRNGFIDDRELDCRPQQVSCAELVKAMACCAGVLSVNDVMVRVGRRTFGVPEMIPVPAGAILRLDPGLQARFLPIRLVHQGGACQPDRERVARELARRWRAHRQTFPLSRDYAHNFALPRRQYRDLGRYSSVQAQFPATYGIGPRGLSSDAPPLRRAQAKQLKGYLLVFERLLVDYLSRLEHAKDLLSADADLDPARFVRPLAEAIPGAGELLIDEEAAMLDSQRSVSRAWVAQRNRVLDFLLALYAEELPAEVRSHCGAVADAAEGGRMLIDAKLGLLGRLVAVTRARGRGFDFLAHRSARNIAGLELRSRLQLGMDLVPAPAQDAGDRRQLYLVEHILLRAGRKLRGTAVAGDGFDYGLTVSAVVCVAEEGAGDAAFRQQAAAVLLANTPPHITLVVRFLTPDRARSFAALHRDWCEALRDRDPRPIVERSIEMRDFLMQCPPEADTRGGSRA